MKISLAALSASLVAFLLVAAAGTVQGQQSEDRSVFLSRPADDHAPTFSDCRGDGKQDCTKALQAEIDRLQQTRHHGVIFIKEGRYRLTGTVYVWTGIRLIGFGSNRPVFVLSDETAGFEGPKTRQLFYFAHERPAPGMPIKDATSDTFYSGMLNIDFEVGKGNPGAVGLRFHVAQHGILSHLVFRFQSGHAALEDVGNFGTDLHIVGGDYGIDTGKTSPGWQFMLMDSVFEEQKRAGILTHEAGMTLERVAFQRMPVGVAIPEDQIEELYLGNVSFSSVAEEAIRPGNVRNIRSQISVDQARCSSVRRFLPATLLSAELAPNEASYTVERLRLGRRVGPDGRSAGIGLEHKEHRGLGKEPQKDLPALPPVAEWTSVRQFGALGDGVHDDTEALRRAIASASVLYFPAGIYRLTDTLELRPDTILLGLHPFVTQLVLADYTPGFQGSGPSKPLVIAPPGGRNIVHGIAITTGALNPRASGILWQAGPNSMIQDVKFIGGRGTLNSVGQPLAVYAPVPSIEERMKGLSTQNPSLVVESGGGGIFRAIWSANNYARAGLVVKDTTTPGRIYGFSCEHHLRSEAQFLDVANWKVEALQTEEEKVEGRDALPLKLENTRDLLFANFFSYRVTRSFGPASHAIELRSNAAVEFANVHVFGGSRYGFDASLFDQRSGVSSRLREFNAFDSSAPLLAGTTPTLPKIFAPEGLKKVLSGMVDITGLVPLPEGDLLFIDASSHRLYRWQVKSGAAEPLPLPDKVEPLVLAGTAPDHLLLLDTENRRWLLNLDAPAKSTLLHTEAKASEALLLLAGGHNSLRVLSGVFHAEKGSQLWEPNGPVLPAPADPRPLLYGTQFEVFHKGESRLLVTEDDARIFRVSADPATAVPVAEIGGSSVLQLASGEILVAGEQVSVLDAKGALLGTLEVPTRPTALALGGPEGRTLYIAGRGTLYSIQIAPP